MSEKQRFEIKTARIIADDGETQTLWQVYDDYNFTAQCKDERTARLFAHAEEMAAMLRGLNANGCLATEVVEVTKARDKLLARIEEQNDDE